MGYTHYMENLDESIITDINKLYRSLLSITKNADGKSLLDVAKWDRDGEEFDRNFHEYSWEWDDIIALFSEYDEWFRFTKTARKDYDPAVAICYAVVNHLWLWKRDGDYAEENEFQYDDNLFAFMVNLFNYSSRELWYGDAAYSIQPEKAYRMCYAFVREKMGDKVYRDND